MAARQSAATCGARGSAGAGARELSQPLDRLAQQSRDLHLRDADLGGDLALRHVLDEAQAQDPLLALRQTSDRRAEQRARLGAVIALVIAAERVGDRRVGATVVMPASRRRKRQRGAVR